MHGSEQLKKKFDPALTASKLPKPMQKPGGFILSLLGDLTGADDPLAGINPSMFGTGIVKPAIKGLAGLPKEVQDLLAKVNEFPVTDPVRASRAWTQGYRTPVWHGTPYRFNEFAPASREVGDFGIHVATSKDTARKAAGGDPGAHVMDLVAKIENPLNMRDIGVWNSPATWMLRASNAEVSDPGVLKAIQSVAGRHMKDWSKNPLNWLSRNPNPTKVEFGNDIRSILEKRGYDAIKYPNSIEGMGEPSYLLLDPMQLKSIHAKFDPEKYGKTADLLAGLAGISAGTAAASASKSPTTAHPYGARQTPR